MENFDQHYQNFLINQQLLEPPNPDIEESYLDLLEERFLWDFETGDYSIFQPIKKEI